MERAGTRAQIMNTGDDKRPTRAGRLVPYHGHRLERAALVGTPHTLEEVDHERSGTVRYAINSLGYRGDEFRPDARFTLFVFGESLAFGTGVAFDECWTSRLFHMMLADRGMEPADACCMNFADPGTSNANIARMVVTQCGAVRPDFVIVQLADPKRTEGYEADRVFPVGDWYQDPATERSLFALAPGDPQRKRLLDCLRRGRSYLEFTSCQHSQLDALHHVLLVQSYLALHGIPYVIAVQAEHDASSIGDGDAILEPLRSQIDRTRYVRVPTGRGLVIEDMAADQRHFGPRTHAAFARHVHTIMNRGEAAASLAGAERANVGAKVRSFYETCPFNLHGTVAEAVAALRSNPIAGTYPDLHRLLRSGSVRTILEIGCGTGWLTNALARHYDVSVTAVDFTPPALERARQVAQALGNTQRIRFHLSDLFAFEASAPVDLVVSLGVLHHTGRAESAFRRVQGFARDGGHVYVGLYHEPGRRVFLDLFHAILARDGEEAALARFRELDQVRAVDPTLARSWFRDQVLHPHETCHTLREVCGWMRPLGLSLLSTSINRFAAIGSRDELLASEQDYAEISRKANLVEKRYFPGFFTFLCQRPSGTAVPR